MRLSSKGSGKQELATLQPLARLMRPSLPGPALPDQRHQLATLSPLVSKLGLPDGCVSREHDDRRAEWLAYGGEQ